MKIELGTVVYSHSNRGVIVAIHGESKLGNEATSSSIIASGRGAEYDVVWSDGVKSSVVPEAIVRHSTWTITEDKDSVVKANALCVAYNEAKELEKIEKSKKDLEATIKAKADFPHLTELKNIFNKKETNKNIREFLKKEFPGIKFSVRSPYFGVTNISWKDESLTIDEVKAKADIFSTAQFNAYEDYGYNAIEAFNSLFGSVDYIRYSNEG